jgi:predicted aspartyl protease
MQASIPLVAILALLSVAEAPGTETLEELAEVTVTAPEPRYAAPTTRDRIGRVWVPVIINGKGPFRLVLDTGAQRSAIVPHVASTLGIPLDRAPPVMLHGVTGKAVTPSVDVDMLRVGDLWMQSERLPVVADAFGGADGLLGMDGMQGRRIYIDFRADHVDISLSRNKRALPGFVTLPVRRDAANLLMVDALVGNIKVRTIIDTGAQATVGNEALRQALWRQVHLQRRNSDEIVGATGKVQSGMGARISALRLGSLEVRGAYITFSDLHIFDTWGLSNTPALLIGMDLLGLVDTLVIDYRLKEVHIKARES